MAGSTLPLSKTKRMYRDMSWQHSRMRSAGLLDLKPVDMTAKVVFVTGGNGGIGKETCKKLYQWGAEVIMGCRRPGAAETARQEILDSVTGGDSSQHAGAVSIVQLDLADLDSVKSCVNSLQDMLGDRKLYAVDLNAGIAPTSWLESKQGYEMAFAVNVLGNFVLCRELQKAGLLRDKCRVVIVTGDIYILANDCTPKYKFRTSYGSTMAYARSKLGVMWYGLELAKRNEGSLEVVLVHPGVIDTGLLGNSAVEKAVKRRTFLTTGDGTKAPLFCIYSDTVNNGDYYLNICGKAQFKEKDPANDRKRAEHFWKLLESLSG